MAGNEEFSLDDLDLGDEQVADVTTAAKVPKKKAAPKKAAPKKAAPEPEVVEEVEVPEEDKWIIRGKDRIEPRSRWSTIMIDEVQGLNNFEVVGVNGRVYQMKRGVPVKVPQEVIHALQNAQLEIIEQKFNERTGKVEETKHYASSIPWRRA